MGANLKELCQQVYIEVCEALADPYVQQRCDEGVVLERLRIRLGEPSREEDEEEAVGIVPPELGWQIDMTFNPDLSLWAGKHESVGVGHLFDRFPTSVLQGVGPEWRKRLLAAGIRSVGALAACSDELVRALCREHHSNQPAIFQHLAQMSQEPFPYCDRMKDCGFSLYDIGFQEPTLLEELIEAERIEALIDYCRLMATIIDADFLKKFQCRTVAEVIEVTQ